jgi:hypothetical protein
MLHPSKKDVANPCVYQELTKVIPVKKPPKAR